MKQLKLLITLGILATAFLYLQSKFNFLGISISENEPKAANSDERGGDTKEIGDNYVEIFIDNGKSIKVNVEFARTDQERALGLSNRKYLGTYDGMWFVFEKDMASNSFWMKDCLIPLDIIFVDSSGFIVDIKDNNAPCTDAYCPMIHSSTPYRYVLEVNANFANSNEVYIGHSITTHFVSSD